MNSPMCEPVRLAAFLRERCSRNMYGLRYLDQEQTLMQIPWPVVPKQSNGVPPGFQIFQDWTALSFLRRGRNRDCSGDKEPPTNQKHRFRNALARANGILYRDDIKVEGARVYQFVENQEHCKKACAAPPPLQYTTGENAFIHNGYSPNYGVLNSCYPTAYNNQKLPYIIETKEDVVENGCEGQTPSDTNVMEDILQLINDTPSDQETVFNESPIADLGAQELVNWDLPMTPVETVQPDLEVKVCFRQDEAWRCFVTSEGCRLFFGKNIQNLSQRLAKDHLHEIMKKFRFNKEHYFGPESIQQIELPRPNDFMRTSEQKRKTEAILENMERGLLLYVDQSLKHEHLNVPDVYAMRLCQTRVFPCSDEHFNGKGNIQAPESLQRMKWTKVFDGKRFSEQLLNFDQLRNCAYPSPSFSLSLGQRPSGDERSLLFISLIVTVQQAQQLIQSRLDCERDVSISNVNSTDLEARCLASQLTTSLNLAEGAIF